MIYDCDVSVEIKWNKEQQSFVLADADLPFFVNNDWDVDPSGKVAGGFGSAVVPPRILHFFVYIPPKNKSPLSVRSQGSLSQSFTISSWGGVFILNQKYPQQSEALGRKLTQLDHQKIAQAAVSQLRVLLGLAATPGSQAGEIHLQDTSKGFTKRELDGLVLNKLSRDIKSSWQILSALDRLIDNIPNLEIPDLIQNQVCQAVC